MRIVPSRNHYPQALKHNGSFRSPNVPSLTLSEHADISQYHQ